MKDWEAIHLRRQLGEAIGLLRAYKCLQALKILLNLKSWLEDR